MVITETREQLVQQLNDAWNIITQADEALTTALDALQTAHTNLRNFTRSRNGQTDLDGASRMDTTGSMETRPSQETRKLRRMPTARKEYVLRPR